MNIIFSRFYFFFFSFFDDQNLLDSRPNSMFDGILLCICFDFQTSGTAVLYFGSVDCGSDSGQFVMNFNIYFIIEIFI